MMKNSIALAFATAAFSLTAFADMRTVEMMPGENWWGAANYFGTNMPFTAKSDLTIDLRRRNYSNQCASMLVSDMGRVIWADEQSEIVIKGGVITMDANSPVVVETASEQTLAGAYRHAMRRWFPPSGYAPDVRFFTAPQLNTWIELTYNQNQKDILRYARSMLEHGIPPGVLMIDDTWQAGYGDWRFEPSRFPDPKAMIDELHAMGYKVMLWMCPYVGMDLPAFRRIAWGRNPADVRGYPAKGGFLNELSPGVPGEGEYEISERPKSCGWWNGYSAFLDFSHPNANAWFTETLNGLVRDFGVDGFKFDGADLGAYTLSDRKAHDPKSTSGSLNNGYCDYAMQYPFCEIRNTWRFQLKPVVVRLHDKMHEWTALDRIVADMIAAGLLGHPFICPDMVGGGDWIAFIPGSPFDPELFVRSAQIHALCPMMQISASPWRVLDAHHQAIFSDIVAVRQKFAKKIAALAKKSGETGEPMLRNLEYNFPGQGYASVIDQFMMGDNLLVAPVLKKGVQFRKVVLPPGKWKADDGQVYDGPANIEVSVPLSRLPYFEKQTFVKMSGCDTGRFAPLPDKAFADFRQLTDSRIAEIRATPNMAIPAGAECRYLSENGDDSADGKTPKTAWRTTARLDREKLPKGAFVLFEREGLFRGGFRASAGVTYTAYGEGAKPRIYSSPENGADPAKWERTDDENVWRYCIGTADVGTVVFNDGESHAIKILPVYNDDGTFTQQYGGRPFNNGYKDLAEDLHFWHDYSGKTDFKPFATGSGYLYLRSKQNPGERFKSIEFNVRKHGIAVGGADNVHVDNLCIKYVGSHGIGAGTVKGLRVTNCEFGWIGGSIQAERIFGRKWAVRYGNAVEIYGGCEGFTVENCYVYQVYDAGLTQQINVEKPGEARDQRHVRYSRNVIENCNYSIEYFLSLKGEARVSNPSRMDDFVIEGNLMRNAGVGFCQQRPDRGQSAHIKSWRNGANRATGYVIRDNVFAFGDEMLVEISSGLANPDGSDSMPEMKGNVFIGREGQRFGVLNQGKPTELVYDEKLPATLGDNFSDNVFSTHR